MHKALMALTVCAAVIPGCGDQSFYGTEESLRFAGVDFDDVDGTRIVAVLYDRTDDVRVERSDAAVVEGTFDFIFREQLDGDTNYDVYWYFDVNGNNECDPGEAFGVNVGDPRGPVTLVVDGSESYQGVSCDNVDPFQDIIPLSLDL